MDLSNENIKNEDHAEKYQKTLSVIYEFKTYIKNIVGYRNYSVEMSSQNQNSERPKKINPIGTFIRFGKRSIN